MEQHLELDPAHLHLQASTMPSPGIGRYTLHSITTLVVTKLPYEIRHVIYAELWSQVSPGDARFGLGFFSNLTSPKAVHPQFAADIVSLIYTAGRHMIYSGRTTLKDYFEADDYGVGVTPASVTHVHHVTWNIAVPPMSVYFKKALAADVQYLNTIRFAKEFVLQICFRAKRNLMWENLGMAIRLVELELRKHPGWGEIKVTTWSRGKVLQLHSSERDGKITLSRSM